MGFTTTQRCRTPRRHLTITIIITTATLLAIAILGHLHLRYPLYDQPRRNQRPLLPSPLAHVITLEAFPLKLAFLLLKMPFHHLRMPARPAPRQYPSLPRQAS